MYRVFVDTVRVELIAVSEDVDHWGPTWSADSEWVAYVRGDGASSDIWISDKRGNSPRKLIAHSAIDIAPAWQPEPEE